MIGIYESECAGEETEDRCCEHGGTGQRWGIIWVVYGRCLKYTLLHDDGRRGALDQLYEMAGEHGRQMTNAERGQGSSSSF